MMNIHKIRQSVIGGLCLFFVLISCKNTADDGSVKNIREETVEATKDFTAQRRGVIFLNQIIYFTPSHLAKQNPALAKPLEHALKVRQAAAAANPEGVRSSADISDPSTIGNIKQQMLHDCGDTANPSRVSRCPSTDIVISDMDASVTDDGELALSKAAEVSVNTVEGSKDGAIAEEGTLLSVNDGSNVSIFTDQPVSVSPDADPTTVSGSTEETDQTTPAVGETAQLVKNENPPVATESASTTADSEEGQAFNSDFITCESKIGYFLTPSLVLFRGYLDSSSSNCPPIKTNDQGVPLEKIAIQGETYQGLKLYSGYSGERGYFAVKNEKVVTGYFANGKKHPWALLRVNVNGLRMVDNNGVASEANDKTFEPVGLIPLIDTLKDQKAQYVQFRYQTAADPFVAEEGMFVDHKAPYTTKDVFIENGQAEDLPSLEKSASAHVELNQSILANGAAFLKTEDESKPGAISGIEFSMEKASGQPLVPGIYALRILLNRLEQGHKKVAQELAIAQCNIWKNLNLPKRCGMEIIYDQYCKATVADWNDTADAVAYNCSYVAPCVVQPSDENDALSKTCIERAKTRDIVALAGIDKIPADVPSSPEARLKRMQQAHQVAKAAAKKIKEFCAIDGGKNKIGRQAVSTEECASVDAKLKTIDDVIVTAGKAHLVKGEGATQEAETSVLQTQGDLSTTAEKTDLTTADKVLDVGGAIVTQLAPELLKFYAADQLSKAQIDLYEAQIKAAKADVPTAAQVSDAEISANENDEKIREQQYLAAQGTVSQSQMNSVTAEAEVAFRKAQEAQNAYALKLGEFKKWCEASKNHANNPKCKAKRYGTPSVSSVVSGADATAAGTCPAGQKKSGASCVAATTTQPQRPADDGCSISSNSNKPHTGIGFLFILWGAALMMLRKRGQKES